MADDAILKESNQKYCTFRLEGHLFGLEVERVQEVIRALRITPVPLAPREVVGLINLRGQIVPAVCLRRRLGLSEETGIDPMNVVVFGEDGPVSLLVDEIGDVVEPDPAAFEPPPDTLSGVARDLTKGVFKLDRGLLLILDPDLASLTA